MGRVLQLIDEGYREVFERDAAIALRILQQLAAAEAELAGALARDEERRRADEGPVEASLGPEGVEERSAPEGFRAVRRREIRRVHELQTGRHLQTARTAHDKVPRHPSRFHGVNEDVWVAIDEEHRADTEVMPSQQSREASFVADSIALGRDAGLGGHPLG